ATLEVNLLPFGSIGMDAKSCSTHHRANINGHASHATVFVLRSRLAHALAGTATSPVWTPDGQRLVFGSTRAGAMNVFRQVANGAAGAERVTQSDSRQLPQSFAPNGILLVQETTSTGGTRLRTISPASRDSKTLLENQSVLANVEVSPNGSWLAYQSNESGRFEIYVRPYPNLHSP